MTQKHHAVILMIVFSLILASCTNGNTQQVNVQQPEQSTNAPAQQEVQETAQSTSSGNALVEEANPQTASGESVKEFEMIAKQFSFNPNVIRVKQGDRVIIHARSTDVAHSILIPELNVDVRLPAGETADVEFVADAKGEFDFRCGVPCGAGHRDMIGKIIVE